MIGELPIPHLTLTGFMSNEHTQHQSVGEQLEAERMSLEASSPPTEVPGYRIERFIGAGAFGQVWAARDLNTGRRVAIKFYLHRSGVNWQLLSREVKNLVALSADRYIVQVLEVGWESEPPYYVMEYIESGSLEDTLRACGRLPVAQCVTLIQELAIGLNHCHQKGVLHCDLKPANVLLDNELRPRLADFGQSRMTREQTPALGTLFYMAPEQADLNATPDARWDVYGLGAILYRMLTGNAPHRHSEMLKQIDTQGSLPRRLNHYRDMIVAHGVPKEHRKIAGVDRPLADIVETCLHPDPEKRFQNVQQVLQKLERRDAQRERRPLMLLGIVGPMLLLITTCVFASRSLLQARRQTTAALQDRTLESCRFAAKFVSSTLEGDLRTYFSTIESESKTEGFLERFQAFHQQVPDGVDKVMPEQNDKKVLDALQHSREAEGLHQYLHDRLKLYGSRDAWNQNRPVFATLFVTDRRGTIVAIAYADDPGQEQTSLGRNFAYRTYFHGGRKELPHALDPDSVRPLRTTNLSAPFQSTATYLWKVAVSTPIFLPGNETQVPDGVFVATINLGDFRLLHTGSQEAPSQVAVLVDSRNEATDGNVRERGTILQHPVLVQRSARGMATLNEVYTLSPETLEDLFDAGQIDYQDPLGTAPGGEGYQGKWIATAQRVTLPTTGNVDSEGDVQASDLTVLVQYKMDEVLQPVGALVDRLLLEGGVTVGCILLVTIILWYFVMRAVDEPAREPTPKDDRPECLPTETVR